MIEEGLKIRGRVTLTTLTADGDVIEERTSSNTLCTAGLNDVVAAISYAGVQDIATEIGTVDTPFTPIYGAIGTGPISVNSDITLGSTYIAQASSFTTLAVSGTLSNTSTSTLTVVDATGFASAGTFTIIDASSGSPVAYTVSYTGTTSTTLTGCKITSGVASFSVSGSDLVVGPGTYTSPFLGVTVGMYAQDVIGDIPTGTATCSVVSGTLSNSTASTLTVTTTAGFASSGTFNISHSGISCIVSYAGTTGTTFTGCIIISYIGSIVFSAGDAVSQVSTATIVTWIDPTSTFVALSNNAIGTTSNYVAFSYALTSTSDVALISELERQPAVYAGSVHGSSITNPQFIWQFQFPINSTQTYTITEAGVFTLATPASGSGDLLNHTFINPPVTWGVGQMLMLSVSIGLQAS